jgi:hypothetical protein
MSTTPLLRPPHREGEPAYHTSWQLSLLGSGGGLKPSQRLHYGVSSVFFLPTTHTHALP